MSENRRKRGPAPGAKAEAARSVDEVALAAEAREWAGEVLRLWRRKSPLPRILLSGPMGAGKSTTARHLLDALAISREAEGSPTFAIAHEYAGPDGLRIVHADGYRLRNEAEFEATGLLEPLWDPEVLVLFEWLENFPETTAALARSDLPRWTIRLEFADGDPARRTLRVERAD